MIKKVLLSKTGLLGIGTILAAVGGYLTGAITVDKLVTGIIAGLALITGRHAIEKSGPKK